MFVLDVQAIPESEYHLLLVRSNIFWRATPTLDSALSAQLLCQNVSSSSRNKVSVHFNAEMIKLSELDKFRA